MTLYDCYNKYIIIIIMSYYDNKDQFAGQDNHEFLIIHGSVVNDPDHDL